MLVGYGLRNILLVLENTKNFPLLVIELIKQLSICNNVKIYIVGSKAITGFLKKCMKEYSRDNIEARIYSNDISDLDTWVLKVFINTNPNAIIYYGGTSTNSRNDPFVLLANAKHIPVYTVEEVLNTFKGEQICSVK